MLLMSVPLISGMWWGAVVVLVYICMCVLIKASL